MADQPQAQSGLMSRLSALFSSGAATPTPGETPQQVTQPQNSSPASANPNSPANIPDPSTADPAPKPPLADFADLWQPVVDSEGKPVNQNPSQKIFDNLDPKKFSEAASKIDFNRFVSPETMNAISQGGETGQKAFLSAMNAMAQQAYAQSAFASAQMTEAAIAKAREQFVNSLPDAIRKHGARDALRTNPIFNNPAVQPIMEALNAQLARKHPNASASEIATLAERYMSDLVSLATPPAKQEKTEDKTTDWASWMNG